MAEHSKHRAPLAPFIVTVTAAIAAMALAVMPGCGSNVEGGEEGSASGCPAEHPAHGSASGCPAEHPAHGSACTQPGLECTYGQNVCPPFDVVCESGTWQVHAPGCSPPPYECPQQIPDPGSPCIYIGANCYYPVDPCGTVEDAARCGEDGTWSRSFAPCNPQPPDICVYLMSEEDCVANAPSCRWLVPGCADAASPPALEYAHCFPTDECASDDECSTGETCQARVHDPCYNQPCDACGATAMLCVGP